MSNFLNKIPVSPITSFGNPSVPNGSTIGTNFSILQTGGYMEVYSLSGLTYTIPQAATGIIEFSGNSIPIQFTKGSGSAFSPDVLTLNSDNISSGRRKLGMLVYVYETNKIYQFRIDNYDTLWNNATGATGLGGSTVVISNFGTTIKNNSAAGIALINAWTASTISGVGGYNDTNASWRVLSTGGSSSGGTSFTGGTVPGATNFTGGLTANTFSAGTYYNLPITITGGTYSSGTTFLNNSTGGTINLTGYTYIPHLEYDNSNSTLWNNGFGNVSTNISFGQNALVSNTSGTYNTAIGGESLSATTTGNYNTGIGGGSLTNNTIGVQNFAIGSFALYYNTSGSYNTAIGTAALQDNTVAERNVAIGGFSLYRNTGNRNIAIGFYAGVATKGSDNILLGANANNITDGLVSGSNNTIIGTLLSGVINGSNNTIFGKPTGLSSTTTNNIVIADGSGNIRFRDDNINTILPRLAGVGDRMVIAGSNGELSARTITDTTFTGGTVSGATNFTGGLTANTISATTYYNVSSNFQYEIHVSQIDGNDTTGDGSLLNPVATITKALTLLTGSRKTIIVHPGGYNENVTVANGNTTIATSELTGANTLLSGTLTIGSLGSGSRISGLKMSNLVISGTAQAYISNCTVDTNVIKSSSGYVEIINTEMQCISGIQISGSGTTIINGNKNVGVSVSNASAQVIIKGCNSVVTPSASAGNLAIVDCVVTALGGNAITITGALTNLTLANSQVLVQAGNNVAPISVAGIYSIFNTVYDKANSSLTGTNTNSVDYFQFINADKFITQGGTSLQYVMGDGSLSNGFTGGTVSGATSFTNGLTANTISATTYQNLPTDIRVTGGTYSGSTIIFTNNTGGTFSVTGITTSSAFTGGTVSGATIFTGGVTANTITPTSIIYNDLDYLLLSSFRSTYNY